MEILQGGRPNQIVRSGKTVKRPAGPWSPSVHALLIHLKQEGFQGAPRPFGFEEEGNEILSYIEGEFSNYPLSKNAASTEALITAAQLLRAYHDTTVSFIDNNIQNHTWMLPAKEPIEVICHGDYAPYNVVLSGRQAIALIDFDTAHPGPRIWDIAYALYRWSPLKNPNNPDTLGNLETQIQRVCLFCDAYNLPIPQRLNLVSIIIDRLQTLISFMKTQAQSGNPTFQAHLDDGHHLSYEQDIIYLDQNRTQIEGGLIGSANE